jgi:hypothetical protein
MAEHDLSDAQAALKAVCDRLDVIISLLMPPVTRRTETPKGLQLDILRLCDFDHTTEDIRRTVNKSLKHVTKELSLLRSKGIIRTVRRDGRLVHFRLQ